MTDIQIEFDDKLIEAVAEAEYLYDNEDSGLRGYPWRDALAIVRVEYTERAGAGLAAAYPLLRGPIVDECERDAALLLAAVIAQTGPIFVPNGAMAGSGALTLRMVQGDDGITFSVEEGTTDA
jgi:hypothetical protein